MGDNLVWQILGACLALFTTTMGLIKYINYQVEIAKQRAVEEITVLRAELRTIDEKRSEGVKTLHAKTDHVAMSLDKKYNDMRDLIDAVRATAVRSVDLELHMERIERGMSAMAAEISKTRDYFIESARTRVGH